MNDFYMSVPIEYLREHYYRHYRFKQSMMPLAFSQLISVKNIIAFFFQTFNTHRHSIVNYHCTGTKLQNNINIINTARKLEMGT